MRWYALLEVKPKRHVGHNPLARLAMFFMFTLTVAFMIVTGLALYAQGSGNESWQYSLLAGCSRSGRTVKTSARGTISAYGWF